MNNGALREELLEIICKNSNKDDVEIQYGEGKSLTKDLNYDSVSFVNLIVKIEEKYVDLCQYLRHKKFNFFDH